MTLKTSRIPPRLPRDPPERSEKSGLSFGLQCEMRPDAAGEVHDTEEHKHRTCQSEYGEGSERDQDKRRGCKRWNPIFFTLSKYRGLGNDIILMKLTRESDVTLVA